MTDDVAALMVIFDFGQVGDLDNKVKHTLDGLVGHVLSDDRLVQQLHLARHDLNLPLALTKPLPRLAEALDNAAETGEPFVYLRLTHPRRTEEVLDDHS